MLLLIIYSEVQSCVDPSTGGAFSVRESVGGRAEAGVWSRAVGGRVGVWPGDGCVFLVPRVCVCMLCVTGCWSVFAFVEVPAVASTYY